MANNYLQFSTLIKISDITAKWAKKFVGSSEHLEMLRIQEPDLYDEDDELYLPFEFDCVDGGILIYDEESGDAEFAAITIQRILQKEYQFFEENVVEDPTYANNIVTLSWAATCSRPRPDEFFGGIILISRKEIRFQPYAAWIKTNSAEMIEQLL